MERIGALEVIRVQLAGAVQAADRAGAVIFVVAGAVRQVLDERKADLAFARNHHAAHVHARVPDGMVSHAAQRVRSNLAEKGAFGAQRGDGASKNTSASAGRFPYGARLIDASAGFRWNQVD